MSDTSLTKPKKRIWLRILIILFIIIGGFYIYISQIEVTSFRVIEQAIVDEELNDSYNAFKITQISDIYYGRTIFKNELKKIREKVNELNSDVVVFTGDLLDDFINISDDDIKTIKYELASINANYRKYAILGDNDYVNKDLYEEIMNEAGFIILDNKNDLLYVKSNIPLMFLGTSSVIENQDDLTKALDKENITENYFKILLAHEPIIFDELGEEKINIVLSGHSLGGLVSLGSKHLLKQEGVNNYYSGNFINDAGSKLYVSTGLGTNKYNIRFNNKPTINFYRLYNN